MTEQNVTPNLSAEQVTEMLRLIGASDSVELKLTVPDTDHRSAAGALEMDVLEAQIRQVVFFDTPELLLNQHGLVLRARRVQGRDGDSVVKLRPIEPSEVKSRIRKMSNFGIEVDAMPGGFVCSGSMKAVVEDLKVKQTNLGKRPISKLFTKDQRKFYADHAPEGVALDDLSRLGPINVLKLKFTPGAFHRRMVAELWFYPDGTRLLELSTKCPPADALVAIAETRAFLDDRGIDLTGQQATKTRTALEYFAAELAVTDDRPMAEST